MRNFWKSIRKYKMLLLKLQAISKDQKLKRSFFKKTIENKNSIKIEKKLDLI